MRYLLMQQTELDELMLEVAQPHLEEERYIRS